MNMDRRRFGIGLAGGLVLGLLIIIGTTGFAPGLYGTFGAIQAAQTQNVGVTSSSTGTYTTVSTSTGYQASANTQESSSLTTNSVSSSVSSATNSSMANLQPSTTNNIFGALTGGSTHQSASRLDSIAAQPLLVNGVIVLPILLAIALGALLYRASGPKGATKEPAAE